MRKVFFTLAGLLLSVLVFIFADAGPATTHAEQPQTTPTTVPLTATYFPIIWASDTFTQSLNITEDLWAHTILAECGTYTEEYGWTWNDAYNCTGQFRGITQVSAADIMIADRKHSSYTGNNISRTFIEYPVPPDIPSEQVTGVQFCFNTQYWHPDTVYVHPGNWTPGLIAEIAQAPPEDIEGYYDTFFSPDAWNSRGDAFFTIPPLPAYHPGLDCTIVTVPAQSVDDGVLRWVLRTADHYSPPDEGAWGLSNYTFQGGVYTYTDVYLIYRISP